MRLRYCRVLPGSFATRHYTPQSSRSALIPPFEPRGISCILAFAPIIALALGCGEQEQIAEEIRSLKTFTVGEVVAGQQRRFSGVVRAVDRSGLSFEVPGNVLVVNVDIGANVKIGQILAELDKEPYKLEVQKAEAKLATANASVQQSKAEFERQKDLLEKRATSQRQLERAEFALKEAEASVESCQSELDLAKRDLNKTELVAPFDGSIGVRNVEPFVEVQRGQVLFEIDAVGDQEVVVNIPETIVNLLSIDMPASVTFPTLPGKIIEGKVTDIGTVAAEGRAYPVQVRLIDPPTQVRSGMTAEATFELKGEGFAAGYPIPGNAVKPTTETNRGFVFIYDSGSSTVKQTAIRWRGVKDNMAIVSEGVSPGDMVASAGVSFLSDGMEVKLMTEAKAKQAKPETLDIE